MNLKTYLIICKNCGGSNKAMISQKDTNTYLINLNDDHKANPDKIAIVSGRYRPDMQFGWECICGNYSLLARQEIHEVENLVSKGSQSAIEKIKSSLEIPDDNKFTMQLA